MHFPMEMSTIRATRENQVPLPVPKKRSVGYIMAYAIAVVTEK